MYLSSNQSMQLLKITTRQGLFKIVKNHNITVKSQGVGKPNLYLKSDLERYMKDNAKNIKIRKNPQVIEKAEKIVKDIQDRKVKNKKLKVEVKKEILKVCQEVKEENLFDEDDIIKPPLDTKNFTMKDLLNEIGQDEFDRVVELLKENGTYKEQDRGLVLAYAVSYQKYVYSTIASAKMDDTTSDQFGNLKTHPYFTVSDKCLTQMTKIGSILGIGIRSRIGLEIQEKIEDDSIDIFKMEDF